MRPLDPLNRAQILARFDRVSEAIAVVRGALQADPTRVDLQKELVELTQREAHSSGVGALKHQLAGWFYFLVSFAVVYSPVFFFVRAAGDRLDKVDAEQEILSVCVFIAFIVAMVFPALRLFLWLWFRRLARMPSSARPFAEQALARAMAVHAMEPQYSRIRDRMLEGHDA